MEDDTARGLNVKDRRYTEPVSEKQACEQLWDVMLATCPSRSALATIANKWTVLVVNSLQDGPQRFGDLRGEVGGISAKMLTEQLRALEREGIVARQSYAESPPRVEYELTELGRGLIGPMVALRTWVEANFADIQQHRQTFDAQD